MIENRHSRTILSTVAEGERLLKGLAREGDPLWPFERWPALRFKEGLTPGACGGHGPIRYAVETVGLREVRFRFPGANGFHGWHALEISPEEVCGLRLTHRMHLDLEGPALLRWHLVIRPLHDALIQDALDKAQAHLEHRPWIPRPLSRRVRFLRSLMLRQPRLGVGPGSKVLGMAVR